MFKQEGWFHCGSDVIKGQKYSVRTELMYEKILKINQRKGLNHWVQKIILRWVLNKE